VIDGEVVTLDTSGRPSFKRSRFRLLIRPRVLLHL
jgi:hypothetical protein